MKATLLKYLGLFLTPYIEITFCRFQMLKWGTPLFAFMVHLLMELILAQYSFVLALRTMVCNFDAFFH